MVEEQVEKGVPRRKRNRHAVARNAARKHAEIVLPASKHCRRCGNTKPAADFARAIREKDGLKPNCKACAKEQRRSWYLRNREREIAAAAAFQQANPEKAREYARKAYAKGQDKFNARNLARYHANKDTIRAQFRAKYSADPEFRAHRAGLEKHSRNKRQKQVQAWQANYRRENRRAIRVAQKAWAERNPDQAKALAIRGANNRRARMVNAAGSYTAADWQAVLAYYAHACAYCLRPEREVGRLTVDHMRPISRGGTNAADNLAPACRSCNPSKGDRTPLEFLTGIRLAASMECT